MWFGKRTQGGMKSFAGLYFRSSQGKCFVGVSSFAALLAGPISKHSLEKFEDLSVGGMPLCLLWHFTSPPGNKQAAASQQLVTCLQGTGLSFPLFLATGSVHQVARNGRIFLLLPYFCIGCLTVDLEIWRKLNSDTHILHGGQGMMGCECV